MPVWAAVVVGLGSGFLSALAGTILTVRHQRQAELRSRMLAAAEEYIARGDAVITALRAAIAALDSPTRDDEAVEVSMADLTQLREESIRALLPLQLLFGTDSRTWEATVAADTALEELVDGFEKWRVGGDGTGLRLSDYARKGFVLRPLSERWLKALAAFTEAARRDIARGWGFPRLRRAFQASVGLGWTIYDALRRKTRN